MKKQKFNYGDLVRVADDLGPSMEHFRKGCNAIVIGSYRDQFGGSDTRNYTIFIEDHGECSWYHEDQLTFIRNDVPLLETWKERNEAKVRDWGSPRWIKENWVSIRDNPPTTSILRLFQLLGCQTSFSRNGEFACLLGDYLSIRPLIDSLFECQTIEDVKARFGGITPEGIAMAKRVLEAIA